MAFISTDFSNKDLWQIYQALLSGGGGLTFWDESGGTDGYGDNFAEFSPKGGGNAIIAPGSGGNYSAQVPDGTPANGNQRGNNSNDWQILRGINDRVASGLASVISGGYNNRAAGEYSTVAGGGENLADAPRATIGGGEANVINTNTPGNEENSTIAGGDGNEITGYASFIGGGNNNRVSANKSSILGGAGNIVTGNDSCIPGGYNNNVSGAASSAYGIQNIVTANDSYSFGRYNTNYASGAYSFGSNLISRYSRTIVNGVSMDRNAHEGGCFFGFPGSNNSDDEVTYGISGFNGVLDVGVSSSTQLVCNVDTSTFNRNLHLYYNDQILSCNITFSVKVLTTAGAYTAGESYTFNQNVMISNAAGVADLFTSAATNQIGDASLVGFESQFAPATSVRGGFNCLDLIFNAPATSSFLITATVIQHYATVL